MLRICSLRRRTTDLTCFILRDENSVPLSLNPRRNPANDHYFLPSERLELTHVHESCFSPVARQVDAAHSLLVKLRTLTFTGSGPPHWQHTGLLARS